MTSREKILASISKNQPVVAAQTSTPIERAPAGNMLEKFKDTLTGIGGFAVEVDNVAAVGNYIRENYPASVVIVSTVPELGFEIPSFERPHDLRRTSIAILRAHFAVSENGAVWITDAVMPDRVLPFICERLMIIVDEDTIVATLHQAYERIGSEDYKFGTYIAGPSKTADIEQSLVLGAHGPKEHTVFIIRSKIVPPAKSY
jgi:L-lactate dehydrogenase complex protein LldG